MKNTHKTQISDIRTSEIRIYSSNDSSGKSKKLPPQWNFFKSIKMFLYNKDCRYGYIYKDISFSFPYICTSVTLLPIYNDFFIENNDTNNENDGARTVIDVINNDDNHNDGSYSNDDNNNDYNDNMNDYQNKMDFLETKILLLDITHGTYDEVLMYAPESESTG